MSKPSWKKILFASTDAALQEAGRLVQLARKRRGMSVVEIADRVGVDRRTITMLEKGSPGVSLGVFFQLLGVLGLLRGLEEALRPENDLVAVSLAVREARRRRKTTKEIPDDKVNF